MARRRLYHHRSVHASKPGGFGLALLTIVIGAAIIALALAFSLLFLVLFMVVVIAAVARMIWMQRKMKAGENGEVIDVDYEVVEREEQPARDNGKTPE